MKKLARNFMKQVQGEELVVSRKGLEYLKDLALKAGSTKYTVKNGRPYFWFGDSVYVKG